MSESKNQKSEISQLQIKWWRAGIIVLGIAGLAIATYCARNAPTDIQSIYRDEVQKITRELERGDLVRMDNGRVWMVHAITSAGLSISPCMDCATETWTQSSLAESISSPTQIMRFPGDGWQGTISQWVASKKE